MALSVQKGNPYESVTPIDQMHDIFMMTTNELYEKYQEVHFEMISTATQMRTLFYMQSPGPMIEKEKFEELYMDERVVLVYEHLKMHKGNIELQANVYFRNLLGRKVESSNYANN